MPTALDHWFAKEILIHEPSLMQFLLHYWPNREEAVDLRQEVYVRVYEAAGRNLPHAPRSFLFATARNLMADRVRRRKVVSIDPMGDFEHSSVFPIDELSPEQWCGGRQMLKRLSEVFDGLPDRCREVVWLRRVDALSQKEVAQRLGISEKTVEKHLAKGMRLLADDFYGPKPASPMRNQHNKSDEDITHDQSHSD